MKSYVLNYAGSGATSEIYANNDTDAIIEAPLLLGEDTVEAAQWDADGCNDDGEPMKRILFWIDEQSAESDDNGTRSIAQLTVVGRA